MNSASLMPCKRHCCVALNFNGKRSLLKLSEWPSTGSTYIHQYVLGANRMEKSSAVRSYVRPPPANIPSSRLALAARRVSVSCQSTRVLIELESNHSMSLGFVFVFTTCPTGRVQLTGSSSFSPLSWLHCSAQSH